VQPIVNGIKQSFVAQLIKLDMGGLMSQKVIKTIHEAIHVLDLLSNNHYCKQTPIKLAYSRQHMAYKTTYLIKTYSIPPALVLNHDQIN
jgi:hypothetical protein